ncbi:MAG: hypothetical protein N2380_01105 [bacterium]|nr:hypothetical protein [bacterium]
MIKNLRLIGIILLATLFFIPLSYAQQQEGPPRRIFGDNKELQYLLRLIQDLNELEKDKKLALSKDQAKKLIPVLQDLMKKESLPSKEAEKFIDKIEGILTDAQLTFIDKIQIERQERFKQLRQQQQQNQSQGGQGFPQNRPPREIDKDMEKVIQGWMQGKPLNPYYYVKSFKDRLNQFIERLRKK